MLYTLLFSIAGGMLALLAMSRPDQIAWKFYRLVGCICLALSVSSATWMLRAECATTNWVHAGLVGLAAIVVIACALVIVLSPRAALRPMIFRVTCVLGGAAGISAACVFAGMELSAVATGPHHGIQAALLTIGQIISSLFLGSITLAWMLGHAYLTATRMTIAPLQRFTRLLMAFVNARLLLVGFSLLISWWTTDLVSPPSPLNLLAQAWLIATMRIGVGLILVSVLAWMVNDCVKLRSTQSATGILYFASVAAYVGELAGQQLIHECHWPL